MGYKSAIEWTDATWNPVTGCDEISAGCAYCYAKVMAHRLQATGSPKYANAFQVTVHPRSLNEPKKWKEPKKIFVNSMSDLFHKDVPEAFIHDVFKTMNTIDRHTYQILTKRPERMLELDPRMAWAPNIHMGVTVEDGRYKNRVDLLRQCHAHVRFLSVEPLIGPIHDLDLTGIHQVIVGGESGADARPMKEEWVKEVLDACEKQGVPFFFKQTGVWLAKQLGLQSHKGTVLEELPLYLRVRSQPSCARSSEA